MDEEGHTNDESDHARKITQFLQEELSGEEQKELLKQYNTDLDFRTCVDKHHNKYNSLLTVEAQKFLEKRIVCNEDKENYLNIDKMWKNILTNIERV
ncbi:hypothetical protein [Candidatus Uabimicrobium sp. HlEnr_7]|uniref:hypothetical protein n=1 Tax=Candidatus Uabimicrobium helgolandensis TaxID=3095367 RepID=UPI0035561114